MSAPFALIAYRTLTGLASPLAHPLLAARTREGKEDATRLGERTGHTAAVRPPGPLVWFHGASVGETRVGLTVREALAARRPELSFLFTSGTRTSAGLFSAPPARTVHQYVPIDAPAAVRRFIAHWRPTLGVFAESDLWPNLLTEAKRAGVSLALVNARMSPKSLASWAKRPAVASHIFGFFDTILAADTRTGEGLAAALGRPTRVTGNLKLAAKAPDVSSETLARLRRDIGDRPMWLAASTHAGEDEIVLAAHEKVRSAYPDALLVIAPRHPERGVAVAQMAGAAPRRSQGVAPQGPVYIADTMGELALFYAAAGVALVAGSLLPALKGHNPCEPARLRCPILSGPFVESFDEAFSILAAANGYRRVDSAATLAAAVIELLAPTPERSSMIDSAERAVHTGAAALDETVAALERLLPPKTTHAAA